MVFLLTGVGGKGALGQAPYNMPDSLPDRQAGINPLQIGDTIPEWLWHLPLPVVNHPEGKDTITLNDCRGKLIILDFWATWCSACLDGFPKMDSLSREFGDRLAVILFNAKQTGDTPDRIKKAFERREARTGYGVTLPYVVGDSIFQQVFPHWIIPHHAWIDGAGVLRASTFADAVTRSNVAALIAGRDVAMHTKRDVIGFEAMATPLAEIHAGLGAKVEFRSLLTGYIEGLGSKQGTAITADGLTRTFLINAPLPTLYNTVFGAERGDLPLNRLVFRLPDSTGFRERYRDYESYGNRYCYEIATRATDDGRLAGRMKSDLESHFGVRMERQARDTAALVIRGYRDVRNRSTSVDGSGPRQGGAPDRRITGMDHLLSLLNDLGPIPVVDESGVVHIDIALPEAIPGHTIDDMARWLAMNGFSVGQETRRLDFAIFTQQP